MKTITLGSPPTPGAREVKPKVDQMKKVTNKKISYGQTDVRDGRNIDLDNWVFFLVHHRYKNIF